MLLSRPALLSGFPPSSVAQGEPMRPPYPPSSVATQPGMQSHGQSPRSSQVSESRDGFVELP
jgi:hypothetical protein